MSYSLQDFNNAQWYLLRGIEQLEEGWYKASFTNFSEVCRLRPNDPRGYLGKSEALFRQKTLEDATKEAQLAVGLMPKLALHYLLAGQATVAEMELQSGSYNFVKPQAAVKISPEDQSQCVQNLFNYFIERFEIYLSLKKDRSDESYNTLEFLRRYTEEMM